MGFFNVLSCYQYCTFFTVALMDPKMRQDSCMLPRHSAYYATCSYHSLPLKFLVELVELIESHLCRTRYSMQCLPLTKMSA